MIRSGQPSSPCLVSAERDQTDMALSCRHGWTTQLDTLRDNEAGVRQSAGAPAHAVRDRMMLRALPALNHSICSGLKVWVHSNSTVVPSGLWMVHRTG